MDVWQEELAALQGWTAVRLRRPEACAQGRHSWCGLLGPVERRSGWQLAARSGEPAPDKVSRLLRTARWDAAAGRDDPRAQEVEHLGDPTGVLVVDESGFLNKGIKSAGVQRQYSSTTRRIEHCRKGVFPTDTSPKARAFLDGESYPPREWAEEGERRTEAGVLAAVPFRTKPRLAQSYWSSVRRVRPRRRSDQ